MNGRATIVETPGLLADARLTQDMRSHIDAEAARKLERWILVEVDEAYIHCSKHIPRLAPVPRELHWGTDDMTHKGGDYFGAKCTRRGTSNTEG